MFFSVVEVGEVHHRVTLYLFYIRHLYNPPHQKIFFSPPYQSKDTYKHSDVCPMSNCPPVYNTT